MHEISCHDSALHEPLAGSAPQRRVWLIIEQPGTWGSNALIESSLPAGFGERIESEITDPEIGVLLARRPDIAAQERRTSNRRRIWLAHTSPGGVRMRSGSLDDIHDVLKFDWTAIKRGELPPIGRRSADPAIFICTNGKRDTCCATQGRVVIDELRREKELTGQVYEVSHIGGHRFAPTALLLPWGYVLGRIDSESVRGILESAWNGNISPDFLRGRSAFPAWAQQAEIAVRNSSPRMAIDALDVVVHRNGTTLPWTMVPILQDLDDVYVRHQDGRSWQVFLEMQESAPRKISCNGDFTSASYWVAREVRTSSNWN